MFERFTEKSIKAIMLAQDEARRLGHNFVGTEQILLGLIGEGTGVAAKVLKSMGVNLKDAQIEVEKIIGRGSGDVEKEIPFTPGTKRVLEFSVEEAQQLGHNCIGTGHLLLGLIREGEGVAVRVLENLGVDISKVPTLINEMLLETDEVKVHIRTRPKSIFERFTDKAIKVIMLAQDEARRLGHNFVGTEHLLVGLIGEGTEVAAKVLKSMGVNLKDAQIEVEKIIGRGSGDVEAEIPFTPRAKRVLELSLEEAQQLGHDYIGTEHLLLGLIREGEGVAVRVLENLGVDLSKFPTLINEILLETIEVEVDISQDETNTPQNDDTNESKLKEATDSYTPQQMAGGCLILLSFGVLLCFFIYFVYGWFKTPETIDLKTFLQLVKAEKVVEIEVKDNLVTVTKKDGKKVKTYIESKMGIYQQLESAGIEVDNSQVSIQIKPSLNLQSFIFNASPWVLIMFILFILEFLRWRLLPKTNKEIYDSLSSTLGVRQKLPDKLRYQLDFLIQVLRATGESNGDSKVIYPLLQKNLDKLDQDFADILRNLVNAAFFEVEADVAEGIAIDIGNFSILIKKFPLGSKANNMEISIAGYEVVLQVFTYKSHRGNWARTQVCLGHAYSDRIRGDKAQNIEAAIAAYEQALLVRTQTDFPMDWAATQHDLGGAYINRIRGDKAQNIEAAIAAFQQALLVRTETDFPMDWAFTQNNLGIAYRNRIRGDKAQNIEAAIAAYEQALLVRTQTNFPFDWADTQNNLGNAYINRIRGDKAQNIEAAIATYEQALLVRTQTDFPMNWADTQNNLGGAYKDRIRGDKAQNIEAAIAGYQQALLVFTQTDFPMEWAMTQNSLGGAYCDRIRGDKAQNIEVAIAAFQQALLVRTQTDFPINWANTQNSLGNAYGNRIRGDKAQNIEVAIAAYQQALLVFTQTDFPMEWAMTQDNLGIAYRNRIRRDKAQNLEAAIAAHEQALLVHTQTDFPIPWASTQNNLGNAYGNRIRGDKAQNLEAAIAAYQQALLVRTQTDFPMDWALTQNNLGVAYKNRIRGDKAQNIEAAIAAYEQALLVSTLEADPIAHLRTTRNLGNLYFDNQNWQLAADNYKKTITAVELRRSWSKDDDRRQEIIEESIDVYRKIVQAYVNSDQIEKALEYVERSRSKRLVDIMASNDRYSEGEIPGEVKKRLKEHEAIQQQINQLWEQQQREELAAATKGRAATEARNKEIAQLEAQKQEVYKKIRSLDRVLAEGIQVAPLEFPKIQALIQEPTTAILSFYTITDDTYLFVLRQDGVKVHTYSGLGIEKLQSWIWEKWFVSYLSSREEWQQQMPDFLQDVGRKLKLEELCKSDLQDIEELILIPHGSLHFLPWNAMPVAESGENKYLGDHFRIRTLASCQILDFCTEREEIKGEVKQGIVEDTHNDLPCSSYEAQYIAQMYGVPEEQRLRGEAATIDSYKLLLSQVQRLLSTHHAQSRIDNCMESALVLADGRLTLGQLLSPAFRFPDLDEVFIDCCETNLGQVQISDDVLTLNTGFLCAGARGVISSLWSVDDLGTCLFSIFYHQLRQEGKNRSLALQLGQRQLRELTGKELKKKYKKELEEALDEKLEAAYKQLQEIERRLDSYAEGSAEYQELKEEREKLVAIYERIFYTKNKYLKAACKKQHPFEHPAYWSAFICAGLS